MNFFKVTDTLYRGSAPESIDDMRSLKASGIKTVLSLEYGWRAWFGGNLNQEIDMGTIVGMDVLSVRMSDFMPPQPADLDACLALLQNEQKQPVFVHCLHGVDRTGFVIAAYRVKVQGWKWDDAYKELLSFGFHNWCYFWWVPTLKKYLGVQ